MKQFVLLAIAGTLLISTATTASASAIRFTQGSLACTITDNSSVTGSTACNTILGDISPENGLIATLGSINGWNVTTNVGRSKPFFGTTALPALDLQFAAQSAAAGTVTIEFTDTGYSSTAISALASQIGGTTQGTSINYSTFADLNNVAFGRGIALSSLGFLASPFSGAGVAAFNPNTATYSITQVITITHGAGATVLTTGDAAIGVVPAPATLLLLGSALVGMGLARRKSTAVSK